ncbi:MAG: glucohydrolase, partial [Clostridia bacterium]|nr:glucohydrolase [Clostridia bacterium]
LRKNLSSVKNGNYKEYGKNSKSFYTYSREDENEKLLVVCSFVGKTKAWKAPRGFNLLNAELLLCNYQMSNRETLAPYECRVYRWKK